MIHVPTYARVEVTPYCPLRCSYCHAEGNMVAGRPLDGALLVGCLEALAAAGMQKIKFLGGEPLVRRDLPSLLRATRAAAPHADLSLITAGVAPVRLLDAAFAAGLDRANLSIHGWRLERFRARGGDARKWRLRRRVLDRLLALGRPLKLNYVYDGPRAEEDLGDLLAWAASRPVVVNLLDNLNDPTAGPATLGAALERLVGTPTHLERDEDPHSLPTTHFHYASGLVVEVKTSQLGVVAPWRACATCPARGRCREGIFAVRLTPAGVVQPCMDRPDWTFPLASWVAHSPGAPARAGERLRAALYEAIARPPRDAWRAPGHGPKPPGPRPSNGANAPPSLSAARRSSPIPVRCSI